MACSGQEATAEAGLQNIHCAAQPWPQLPGHACSPVSVASLTQALVWLHGEECGESMVLATPLPPHAEQLLAGVHPSWPGDYNPSCAPTMPLQRALRLYSQRTILTWTVVLSGYENQPAEFPCSEKVPG